MDTYRWLIYALLCALTLSLSDILTKKYANTYRSIELAVGRIVSAIPVLIVFTQLDGWAVIDFRLVIILLLAVPLEVIAILFYMKAIKTSQLSITIPLLALTPAFLLLTSPLIVNEFPPYIGYLGIFCIIFGNYIIQLDLKKYSIFAPFQQLIKDKGARYMLIVAFLYSITSNLARYGINYSSPLTFATIHFSSIGIVLLLIAGRKHGTIKKLLSGKMIVLGLTSALMIMFHMLALKLTLVTYMISVKRSSLLFSIVFGVIIFNERNILKKLIGGIFIIIGIAIIALS